MRASFVRIALFAAAPCSVWQALGRATLARNGFQGVAAVAYEIPCSKSLVEGYPHDKGQPMQRPSERFPKQPGVP
jgi:hypothetical protein